MPDATEEQLIASWYLIKISADLEFYSSAQIDDNNWGPSTDCMAGVVAPLTPVVPQSPESDVHISIT